MINFSPSWHMTEPLACWQLIVNTAKMRFGFENDSCSPTITQNKGADVGTKVYEIWQQFKVVGICSQGTVLCIKKETV